MAEQITPEAFWQHAKPVVMDPPLVHSELSQGLHSPKYDFDAIEEGSELFDEWVEVTYNYLDRKYTYWPDAVVGVDGGTNRLARPIADRMGIAFLETVKCDGLPVLTADARSIVEICEPETIVMLEDVGTTGRNTLSVVKSFPAASASRIEVLHTVLRSESLPLLDEANVAYDALLKRVLPNFTAKDCRNQATGYCYRHWELLARPSR